MAAADIIYDFVARNPHTVLLDGRSGSGKTTLATQIAVVRPELLVIHMDDIYPGWDGLREASRSVVDDLLIPRSQGLTGAWREWDWRLGVPVLLHDVPADRPILVEGCGSISRRSASLADLGIWVNGDGAQRKSRALARDGDLYSPYWRRWAAQEEAFIREEHPALLADLVIEMTDLEGTDFDTFAAKGHTS